MSIISKDTIGKTELINSSQYRRQLGIISSSLDYVPINSAIPLQQKKYIIQEDGTKLEQYVPTSFINVNLDTREIQLPEEMQDFLSVEKDHRAEMLYFEVDRYYEDVDLFHTTCIIEYVNALNQARIYPVTLFDIDSKSKEGKMLFAWCIGNEATLEAGTLRFIVHFYTVNLETESYIYSLHTKECVGQIAYGLELSNNKIIEEEIKMERDLYYSLDDPSSSSSHSDNYKILLSLINENKAIRWIDV